MDSGLEMLGQAMTIKLHTTDVIANNIANSNTTGFKQMNVATKTLFADEINDQIKTDVFRKETALNSIIPQISSTHIDHTSGAMELTNNPYDFATKKANMMFAIQLDDGSIGYTKDGSFKNLNGMLTTSSGQAVLSAGGSVTELEDGITPQLSVVNCDYTNLKPQGNNIFKLIDNNIIPEEIENPQDNILLGTLETSNVNMVQSMTNLIIAHREYEQMSKLIQGIDELNEQAASEVGSVS